MKITDIVDSIIEKTNTNTENKLDTTIIHSATAKATPVDADELAILDSTDSFSLKKLTFANLRATLGSIPFGSIMPIASNLTGSHSIPASGTVDDDGWIYCDGSAIPAGNTVSGTTPNLTDGRFLRGSTSAGETGGADSFTLAVANLPAHTHSTPNHTHTASSNTTGDHTHYVDLFGNVAAVTSKIATSSAGDSGYNANTSSSGSHSHTITINSGGGGTSGSTGSTTAKEHIPKYVNVQYIMKVA